RAGMGVALGVLSVLSVSALSLRAAGDYETRVSLSASKLLPASLRSGARFKVAEDVPVEGFMPRFSVKSDFGEFVASGRELLGIRAQEIAALAELENVSKSDAFKSSAGAAAKKTGAAVANAAAKPVETVAGVPEGVGRFFKGVGKSAKKAGS